ncbi:unnamed protein product [Rotaria sordida]|uniref:Uncharacterized protein n=1 Tax=Rotaria sordida TaxID=392033 RepID=A0A814P214_9BILA|nr:unnamed protein product [Rotaria sordida]
MNLSLSTNKVNENNIDVTLMHANRKGTTYYNNNNNNNFKSNIIQVEKNVFRQNELTMKLNDDEEQYNDDEDEEQYNDDEDEEQYNDDG